MTTTTTTCSSDTYSRYHVLTCASAEALGLAGEHDREESEVADAAESSHDTRAEAYTAARARGGDCYVIDTEGNSHYVPAAS